MSQHDHDNLGDDLLAAGFEALERGAWQESFDRFAAAAGERERAEACEGLAMAAWWLDDAATVFANRERAYRLYRERDDRLGSARMAIWIGLDHYIYRGELAIAGGWLQRAGRLLEGLEPSAEHGWLAIWSGHIALFEHNDIAAARRAAAETLALARRLALTDLEVLALALEGLLMVSEGQIDAGMRQLDETTTTALSGDVSDVDAIATSCCYLIFACERVRDFDRAAQWCQKVAEFSRRWAYTSMFAICRTHYAAVLIWRGEWDEAERELTQAERDLEATRPGWAPESVLRLAELRRRQGRLDEAADLFQRASVYPLALAGQAEIALERGDAQSAADLVERFLRRVPPADRTIRATGLELAVRVHVAQGDTRRARECLAELEGTALAVGVAPFQGAVCLARGQLAAGEGALDHARRCFEDAIDLFGRAGAPFETAQARVELARALLAAGREQAACAEAEAALDVFRRLGARRAAHGATALLRGLGRVEVAADDAREAASLTRREAEVLRLIASGHDNQRIADELFISVRTVERHVSTVYEKLGATGHSARAVVTAWAFEHGLT